MKAGIRPTPSRLKSNKKPLVGSGSRTRRSGSVMSSHQNVSGASKKISFTFHFRHKSFILDDTKLAELSNNSFE